MPELPEVEVVRRGLARWTTGAVVDAVEVLHPRPVRRHLAGPDDLAARLSGARVDDVVRRGKFLWFELDTGEALLAHLGMSGQLLLEPPDAPDEKHLRVRLRLSDSDGAGGAGALEGRELRFVDQRMFGGLAVVDLVPTPDGLPGGTGGLAPVAAEDDDAPGGPQRLGRPSSARVPEGVAHIARDPFDPHLDEDALVDRLRGRRTGVKRALLDQDLLSGVGNIYADEALWRSRLHGERPASGLTRPAARRLLGDVRDVMAEALAQGGTSFDSLYVDVNGASGYFERGLAVYGREGRPCPRCGAPVRREAFANRSSHSCPVCQPRPRAAAQPARAGAGSRG
ncbi:bifunctional DNA-formamidopyrimidine glycosylase/DNA-(apurinic or apyrimidinic site) lyase [Streptomyces sp. NP160]|uniref:bifunctional DNA-formamidopyrimidine glycosylase/DNA-(apurinic or apyrimidinic site) lyase n=1 Tax=Streptomyces sp. NP160 TaxID=2586637 RepID=UPI001119A01D|nr:bifunctional DNA-formamidopyrimidine glycosylase/DNA-(apurinic or apyrimidinic site) lyase [Streptomyces sp. NP160]TNM68416.1 bifunctional DNA-formamidopyrimidine glycosylase/DNA-(apurinic or apyrimidinic site) lyase [Streptomyces sp. NP160]